MAKANTKVLMREVTMQVCGIMIYNTAMEMNTGKMEATMKEIFNKGKKADMAFNNGLMGLTILVNGNIT